MNLSHVGVMEKRIASVGGSLVIHYVRRGSVGDCSKCQKVQNLAFETLWFRNEATYRLSFVNLYKFNDGHLTSQNLV